MDRRDNVATMKAKKQPCKCGSRTFPHRRDRHCDEYTWQRSLDRRDAEIDAGTYLTQAQRESREYGVPITNTHKQREILEKAKELQRGAINNDF